MIDLGAIAGIPIAVILACLLKCAIEIRHADDYPAEVQNMLFLQCVADCLLPSGLPDPDRYKNADTQQKRDFSQDDNGNSDFEFSDENGLETSISDKTFDIPNDERAIVISTSFRDKVTVLEVEPENLREDLEEATGAEEYKQLNLPYKNIEPAIKEVVRDTLDVDVDVDAGHYSISLIIPYVDLDGIVDLIDELIELLQREAKE